MTDFHLESLSLDELKKLRRDVDKAIETFEVRQKAQARAKLEEMARDMGYSFNELASSAGPKGRKTTVPKYANPDDPTQTWTGRGPRPKWLKAALAEGKALEDFRIVK